MIVEDLSTGFGMPIETRFGRPLPRLELRWDGHRLFAGITMRELDFGCGRKHAGAAQSEFDAWAGAHFSAVVRASQVHGTELFRADEVAPGTVRVEARDGFLVNTPGILLTVSVADCVPALVYAPSVGALALVHAGWRGVAGGILTAAVMALGDEYGAQPSECMAYWGPAIGPCCYPVGEEVVESIRVAGVGPDTERWLAGGQDDPHVDLRGALTCQAVSVGLSRASIVSSPDCTCCDLERFHSYRRDGTDSGRMVFFAGLPG